MADYTTKFWGRNGITDRWKKSKLIPIFNSNGDILECNNYRGIKLMSHFMKLWERVIEARLREIVNIRENQFGFRSGMSTTEPVFVLWQLQEKYREKNRFTQGPKTINVFRACLGAQITICAQK